MEARRVIVIGCRDEHDRETLKKIADWALANGYGSLFRAISSNKLDIYDMTTRPNKGDGVDALKEHPDTVAVITCHLFGLDMEHDPRYADLEFCVVGGRGWGKHKKDRWLYTKANHEIIDICMERGIPLVCFGDQPFPGAAKLPPHVRRTCIARTATYKKPVHVYEKIDIRL